MWQWVEKERLRLASGKGRVKAAVGDSLGPTLACPVGRRDQARGPEALAAYAEWRSLMLHEPGQRPTPPLASGIWVARRPKASVAQHLSSGLSCLAVPAASPHPQHVSLPEGAW